MEDAIVRLLDEDIYGGVDTKVTCYADHYGNDEELVIAMIGLLP